MYPVYCAELYSMYASSLALQSLSGNSTRAAVHRDPWISGDLTQLQTIGRRQLEKLTR
jgi:hypothetical protein